MRKTLALFLSLLMVAMILCSCGASRSNITIEELESALKEGNSTLAFNTEKISSGYNFSKKMTNFEYSGTADSDKYVKSITIVCEHDAVNQLKNGTEVERILTKFYKNAKSCTYKEYLVACYIVETLTLCDALGEGNAVNTTDVISIFSSGKVLHINGWTVKATVAQSKCTMTGTYGE